MKPIGAIVPALNTPCQRRAGSSLRWPDTPPITGGRESDPPPDRTHTVTVVATPVAPSTPAIKGKGKTTPASAPVDEAKLIADIRKRWDLADKSETDARKLFESADIAWQNSRVIKVRVAYAAAMVNPVKGAPNLLNAARILLTDEADTPAKRTAQAKSRKNTLRNYVDAGAALQDAGLANRITEPDEEERKIVANVFRAGNKRERDEAKAARQEGDSPTLDGGNTPLDAEESGDALTITDLVGHIARMNKTLDLMMQAGVVVSEREASNVADMLSGFGSKLAEYSEGK
ncbi:hypothetical protein SEA_BRUHMOMENT_114 [Arthrobacter phage BruhMoment]|nr:hypothetical protein SEA_BRUHMOMENT_114 [Arthrobacter phage BruhMoment]